MTINATHVRLEVLRVFRGVVEAGVLGHGVDAGFIEFGQEIFSRDISIMTGEAVVRRKAKRQKTLVGPGVMGGMAILAAVVGDRAVLGLRPGIDTTAVPGPGRGAMGSAGPTGCVMTFDADC